MNETNDMILTKQKQEEIKRNGVPKGFSNICYKK